MLPALMLFADQQTSDPGPFGGLGPLLPMILIGFAFWFLLLRPKMARERREREDLMKNIKKNDEVVTYSGIIGTVALIKDNDEVVLKVDESSNTRLRVLKSAIMRVLTPKDAAKDGAAPAAEAKEGLTAGSPPAK